MSDWKLPWRASCLCGQIEMKITEPPVVSMACHCRGCQKLTSGPYSLSLLVPSSGFEVVCGAPVIGGLHGEHRQFFCDHCKSWLFTRPNGLDAFVNVRATMLEDPGWVVPIVDIATADKLPQVASGAEHSFEDFPAADVFQPLIQEFAQSGARPS
ncbi:MAG: GFA family protein [Pseudomonadota bacterium]